MIGNPILDQAYLEYSRITTAVTEKEIQLRARYAALVEACEELKEDWSAKRVTAVIHALKAVKDA